jgi:Asp-tRNA(Asn)/Glu-tRNA(Gln) amidotransferase A subunit family amidase
MTAPCELSASEARQLIDRGKLSPLELLDSCITRIEALNPVINAVVADCFDRGREEARAAGERAVKGRRLGVLDGIPVGIEDTCDTEALRTTYGSRVYEDHVPDYDEHVVAALRDAGAIVVAKTNSAEFAAGAHTTNKVYGVTRNPFDPRRTSGAAAFCGIAALRPTPGVVGSDRRAVGMSTFGVQGPMARSVSDLSLMLSAMAGASGGDPLGGSGKLGDLAVPESPDLGKLRVAASVDLGFAAVDEQIAGLFRERVEAMAAVFGACVWRDPDIRYASYAFWYLSGMHVLAAHGDHFKHHYDQLGMNVVTHYEAAMHMDPEQIGWAVAEQTRIYRQFHEFFRDVDLLICPTGSVSPFPVELPYCTHVNGDRTDSYLQWIDLTAGITLTGHPVVQIPCGTDHTGTPFGIQIIGSRRYSERFVMGAAAKLEARFRSLPGLARPLADVVSLGKMHKN